VLAAGDGEAEATGYAEGVGLAAGDGEAEVTGDAEGVVLAAGDGEAEATGDAVGVDVHPAAMKRTAIAFAALAYRIRFIMLL
jgi:hypothetical protein